MARVTVEDCVLQVPNRFELVMFAAQRARDVSAGAPAHRRPRQRQEPGRGAARDRREHGRPRPAAQRADPRPAEARRDRRAGGRADDDLGRAELEPARSAPQARRSQAPRTRTASATAEDDERRSRTSCRTSTPRQDGSAHRSASGRAPTVDRCRCPGEPASSARARRPRPVDGGR